jgi:hypothetical protein
MYKIKDKLITLLENYNSLNWKMHKLDSLIKDDPNLKNEIILATAFCPNNFPLSNRYKFILNDITEFPKCKNCQINSASFNPKNYRVLEYCSKKCASNHIETRKKVKKTNLKNFGVDHNMKSESGKTKYKKTCLKKYGVDNVSMTTFVKTKRMETNIKNWGVDNVSKNEKIKSLKQKTCFKNYGTNYPAQNEQIFKKQESTCGKIKKFKNTNLTYQGTYELYFLNLMHQKKLINEISNGKSFTYILNNKKHVYYTDFYFRNINVEIKSTWFYNKNGKDLNLEQKNKTKWDAVKNSGENILILMSKLDIKNFVDSL